VGTGIIKSEIFQLRLSRGGHGMFERVIVVADLSDDSYALVERLGALKAYGVKECLLLHCLDGRGANSITLSYITSVVEANLKAKQEILEQLGYTV